jgi:hypothetical protein
MNIFFKNTWKFHEIHFRGRHSRDRIVVLQLPVQSVAITTNFVS